VFAPQPTQVKCPQCQRPFVMSVQTIVDVGQQPELKEELLRGRLNQMFCPACKMGGILAAPLLYHDPDHELLLALIPMQLGLKMEEQERTIGSLTNALMAKIPPEQRKGYLLQPKTVFSLETLIRDILQADGITPEMIEAQNRTMRLIEDLVSALEDEEKLTSLVEEHESEINYEFLLTLSKYAEMVQQEGDQEKARQLIRLRETLVAMTGSPAPDSAGAVPGPQAKSREELVDLLIEAPDKAARKETVAVHRPLVDYAFFQTLTNQIDSARTADDAEKAERLTNLRTELLEITDELDREARAELEKAATLLQEILLAPDREQAIRDRIDRFNEAFLLTLAANIAAAQDQKQEEVVKTFEELYEQVLRVLEDNLPPELKLVNQLMRAETSEARRDILQSQRDLVTPRFLELLDALAKDAEEQQQKEAAQRLHLIREETAGIQ